MDDEMLLDLLAQAILKSACAVAKCRVSAEPHKWFVFVVHLDDHAHTCPACIWGTGYPRYFISNETILTSDRGALVGEISRWLSHLHSAPQPTSTGSAGSLPVDGNAPPSTPDRSGALGPVAFDVAGNGGHCVVSVRAD